MKHSHAMKSMSEYDKLFPAFQHLATIHKPFEVLWVSDGGSKAWGYDSPTSDMDVKFMYRSPKDHYVSLFDKIDHMEYRQDETLELTGWDLRKVLRLAYKGNAQAYELFASPLVYFTRYDGDRVAQAVMEIMKDSLKSVAYHYYGLAFKTYKERMRQVGEQVVTKKYLYVLRPMFHVLEMTETQRLPTLTFDSIMTNVKHMMPDHVYETTTELLNRKRQGDLTTTLRESRLEALDQWLEFTLQEMSTFLHNNKYFVDNQKDLTKQENLDILYRQLLA
jgi:hypothetical protein